MNADALVLRDIHQPPAPGWWPPAPGWWLLAALVLLAAAWFAWRAWRRRQRRRALVRLFDDTVARAQAPAEQVAAMSELLRRAARTVDPRADTLLGDDWLRFLDEGMPVPAFSAGAGALLRDGGYRREVPAPALRALHEVARERFLRWMEPH
ncbi:MAG TPA: DUF4381 family protein [Xanthomonadaceae bacterium]|nr:DUF4381 family protein [Xanthomonadaceae bacterium]